MGYVSHFHLLTEHVVVDLFPKFTLDEGSFFKTYGSFFIFWFYFF